VTAGPSYDLLTSEADLKALTERLLSEAKPFGFDIETGYDGESREKAQLHPEENFIAGISLTNSVSWARYIPVRHDSGENMDPECVFSVLEPLLRTGLGIAHGGKFELRCIAHTLVELGLAPDLLSAYFLLRSDTMLEAHAEGTHKTVALKPLTLATFHHQMTEIMELFPDGLTKKEEDSIRFNVLDQHDPKVYSYACEDSVYALGHHLYRYPRVRDTLIYKVEMGILPIACEMEDNGLLYDWSFMRDGLQRGEAFRERMSAEISADLSEMLGEPVSLNLASPKQVADVLYNKLGLPAKHKSRKTGNPSTDKIAMKTLSARYPVCQRIVEWKGLTRLCGTYLGKYERDYSYAPDGRTHPNHLQHGVPAGRFAVAGPPYQQSPKKYHYELHTGDTFDFNFRNAIVAPPEHYGLGFDYSQIELRVMAGEAGEDALIEAFAEGRDVHRQTGSLMLRIPLEEVTDEFRAVGKTMNFALGYGLTPSGLADRLGIPLAEAQDLFDQWFGAYSHIKAYMDRTITQASQRGYVTTKFGRRVPIWEFESAERWKRSEGERLAGNAPIQGGAADYMKVAMIRADKALRRTGLHGRGVRLVMNIHDALEWYVPRAIQPAEIIGALTEPGVIDKQSAIVFPVEGWPPMVAEWHAWKWWGTARELEYRPDGSVVVKGEREEDAMPGEDDEDGPSLPKVDLDALRRERAPEAAQGYPVPAGPGPATDGHLAGEPGLVLGSAALGPPRTVIIDAQRPGREAFAALAEYVGRRPGPHTLILRMPEGVVPFAGTCGVTPVDEANIALILSGARITYDPASVDFQAVGAGLEA
jgi:DNA polymerase I-like protein with 3'-5' exonuclease and polymerase domains